jgi:hypothetical protein
MLHQIERGKKRASLSHLREALFFNIPLLHRDEFLKPVPFELRCCLLRTECMEVKGENVSSGRNSARQGVRQTAAAGTCKRLE